MRPRAHDRHVAAVIARRLILLVGAVVFLVDHNESDPVERGEHGAPRADDDVDVAPPDAVPLIVTLAIRQATVLNCHAVTKARAEQKDWADSIKRNREESRKLEAEQKELRKQLDDDMRRMFSR